MIMAACAPKREPLERSSNRIDNISKIQILIGRRSLVAVAFSNREKSCRRYLTGVSLRIVDRIAIRQNASGDLFTHKLIKRQIAVESLDHPVAIFVRFPHWIIGTIAGRVRISRDV